MHSNNINWLGEKVEEPQYEVIEILEVTYCLTV
jgi:hypothetical protein